MSNKRRFLVLFLLWLLALPPVLFAETAALPDAETASPSQRKGESYSHLMRSLLALRSGEHDTAVEELHNAVALEPDSPDLLLEAASLLVAMRRSDEAERLVRRALTIDADHRESTRFLAEQAASRAFRTATDTDSRDEALRLYQKLADADDVDPEVLQVLARLRLDSGDRAGAIEAARRLLDNRPGDREAAQMLTQMLLQDDKREEALGVLLRFLAVHPYEEDFVTFSRQLAYSAQRWDLVATTLGGELPPNARDVHLLLAEAQRWNGEPGAAAETLERALAGTPGDPLVRKELTATYQDLGRWADAVTLIRGFIADEPAQPVYWLLLAETLSYQGDTQGALSAYESALDAFAASDRPANERDAVRQQIVLLHLGRDEVAAARSVFRGIENPDDPSVLETRARLAIRSEDWADARSAARRLKADEPGLAAMLEGQILVHQRRWGQAEERFQEAEQHLGPASAVPIAEIYRQAERPESGERLLRRWVVAEPQNADARYRLGVFLFQIERPEEAEQELREALRLAPDHAPALNFVGYSLAERGLRLEEALELIQRALAVEAWNGAYLDSLGWAYYQLGRYEEAREPLERAAREMPNDPTVLEHLGDLYLKLGERSRALETWKRALHADPKNAESLQGKISTEEDRLPPPL